MNKQAIIDALRAFTCQRPGFELANYSTMADYRSDYRRTLRDRDIALQLLRDIELRDSITAADILAECRGGRITIAQGHKPAGCVVDQPYFVDYCTGQYWPVEYRAAVARLCASVLWTWKREKCMPSGPNRQRHSNGDTTYWLDTAPAPDSGFCGQTGDFVSGGDYLRASFRREYGKAIAGRFFS